MSIVQLVPMWRFTERIVRSGLVIAWRFATSPTRTSPVLENATTDGVVRDPSALGITTGSPASRTATTELVVPRSIPTALGMGIASWCCADSVTEQGAQGTRRVRERHPDENLEREGINFVQAVGIPLTPTSRLDSRKWPGQMPTSTR